ncbi:hypothetical protein [Streptomyces olindensis]|uniref:hypothetical protein n=1 Tax=Streptomyces olindensis TaxID=358823 RepID=UPI0033C2FDDD
MRHIRKSTLKKSALIVGATALAASGLLTVAGFASANTPGGATNIKGVDPGNTDWLLHHLCGNKPEGLVAAAYNVETGELKFQKDYMETVYPGPTMKSNLKYTIWKPYGKWEIFSGRCSYPQLGDPWDADGQEVQSSTWYSNHGSQTDERTITNTYTSKRHATNTVGAEVSFDVSYGIVSASVKGSFSREWGWEKTKTRTETFRQPVAPCTELATFWVPRERHVRVAPIFEVESYQWATGRGDFNFSVGKPDPVVHPPVNTWRGRDYNKIYSEGYYIEAVADVILDTDVPAGREAKRERNLDPNTCNRR